MRQQAAALPLSQLDEKEALFEQIDALELSVNERIEEVLEELKDSKVSERGGRAQDKVDQYAMQKLRVKGYM